MRACVGNRDACSSGVCVWGGGTALNACLRTLTAPLPPTSLSPSCPPPCRESWRRAHVWGLVERLGAGLNVPALSPIVPLVIGGEGPALELSAQLLRAGMHVPAIRPPTVPAGTCR